MSTVQPILAPAAAASSGFSVTAGCALPRAHFVRMFKPQFAAMVENGIKLQTVRPRPKRMPKPGDTISLRCWTGAPYRSKQRVLREATITKVAEIAINKAAILLDGRILALRDEPAFAQADGFATPEEMRDWFRKTHALPFVGIVLYWHNDAYQPAGGAATSTTKTDGL